MEEPEFYLVFTGLGKTYFCQHHLGWIDLDEEVLQLCGGLRNFPKVLECYAKYGYKILTNASKKTIPALRGKFKHLTIYLPENTLEAKEFILDNVRRRNQDQVYPDFLRMNYDHIYQELLQNIEEGDTIVYVPAGKYFEDVFLV